MTGNFYDKVGVIPYFVTKIDRLFNKVVHELNTDVKKSNILMVEHMYTKFNVTNTSMSGTRL